MEATLTDFLKSQEDLVREAALALPHQFSQCTWLKGPLRQAVYLCLTCPEERGICSACSVACHTNHEQVELYPKRNFRCDCPTTAINHPCTLHSKCEEENASNQYGRNFRGTFCRCGRPYDAMTERETMIQCLACEDWFHESCCNLRECPISRELSPIETQEDDDDASEASSSGLPPPLLSGSDYESFICAACVFGQEFLQKWAGSSGAIVVTRESLEKPWRLEQNSGNIVNPQLQNECPLGNPTIGFKRPLSLSDTLGNKRIRTSYGIAEPTPACSLPPVNPEASRIYARGYETALDLSTSLGTGDIFFTKDFRSRWCRCDTCLPSLKAHPYLLEEEETYEPPEDSDSGEFPTFLPLIKVSKSGEGLSLEELGLRALERIPRDKAIDAIHEFQNMRNSLMAFLKPFAQQGKVVSEADVRSFFASLEENSKRIQ